MPRDSSGVYKLPAGNPVAPDTVIESEWANSTLDDVAVALTGSLARSGVAPMLGPLVLSADPIVQARQAASKAYVDQFLAYSTGMPIAAISPYAGPSAPLGWLLCDGQAVLRATYPELFAAIGTIYGVGDNATTFNVPDLRNEFIRGLGGSRTVGSKQAGSFAAHTHGVAITSQFTPQDHTHGFSTGGMSANAAHGHTVGDPGHAHSTSPHSHGIPAVVPNDGSPTVASPIRDGVPTAAGQTSAATVSVNGAATGVSVGTANTDHTHSGTTGGISANHTHDVNGSTVGAGGAETVPQNMALNYYIKATKDSVAVATPVLAVESIDTEMITINSTVPTIPVIQPRANVPGGIPKLDANAKVPLAQIPNSVQNNLGFFDASSGNLPSGTFASGDMYTISVSGTLNLYDPVTLLQSPTVVPPGTEITYITGSPTNPTGWYAQPMSTSVVASAVAFTPGGTISAANVQDAITELDTETQTALGGKAPSSAATAIGTSFTPSGTISANNVQTAIEEVSGDVTALANAFVPLNGSVAMSAALQTPGIQSALGAAAISITDDGKLSFPSQGQSLTSNGYVKFPGGLIIQWGAIIGLNYTTTVQTAVITYPIPFTVGAFVGFVNRRSNMQTANSPAYDELFASNTASAGQLIRVASSGTANINVEWIAIGF